MSNRRKKLSQNRRANLPKLSKAQEKRIAKQDEEVERAPMLAADADKWKKKNGIKGLKELNPMQQKNCSARIKTIENQCWNRYGGSIKPKEYCKTRNCKRCKDLFLQESNKKYPTQCGVDGKTRARSNAVTSRNSRRRFTGDLSLKF